LARLWAKELIHAPLIFAVSVFISCGPRFVDRPNTLNPKLVFTTGSSFLSDATTLAVKGNIEFKENRLTQSGSFQLYLNGPDSLAFLIEGPFGIDEFRMAILDETVYILKQGEWLVADRDSRIDIPEYGIANISPFLIGTIIFPQYYPASLVEDSVEYNPVYDINGTEFIAAYEHWGGHFRLTDSQTDISADYFNKKEFDSGFYPSRIEITGPGDKVWEILIKITKVRKNVTLPLAIWQHSA
jgi:hypothetical protein